MKTYKEYNDAGNKTSLFVDTSSKEIVSFDIDWADYLQTDCFLMPGQVKELVAQLLEWLNE